MVGGWLTDEERMRGDLAGWKRLMRVFFGRIWLIQSFSKNTNKSKIGLCNSYFSNVFTVNLASHFPFLISILPPATKF